MKPNVESLLRTVRQLGEATGDASRIDEVRLARLLSQHVTDETVPTLIALLGDANVHSRRVVLQAVRQAAVWTSDDLVTAVVDCLDHPMGFVRYDAAWALGASGQRSRRVITALERVADGADPSDDVDLEDPGALARLEAARALIRLGTSPRVLEDRDAAHTMVTMVMSMPWHEESGTEAPH